MDFSMDRVQSDVLVLFVNGKKVEVRSPDPETTLLHHLRTSLLLTGTKLGCGEGGCGACTVMVSRWDRRKQKYAVNACLTPLCAMHGLAVTTVEGIGSTATRLHPVQERLAKAHGSQCGFCTPGMVMSMYALLRSQPQPSMQDMEKTFQGNLCRCTGYRPIIEGYRTFTKEFSGCAMGDQCCRNRTDTTPCEQPSQLYDRNEFAALDPTQELIFPSDLQLSDEYDVQSLRFHGERVRWYRPTSLKELLELKCAHPTAKLVGGNTEIGIEMKQKSQLYPVLICLSHVTDLSFVTTTSEAVAIGAATTLADVQDYFEEHQKGEKDDPATLSAAIVDMLHWFAGQQIRNVATIGGNLMTASPISDLNPLLQAAGASATLTSKGSERRVKIDGEFFTGYRKTAILDHEILTSINIPLTQQNEYFCAYKQAQRREDDISIVSAGMRVRLGEGAIIEDIALSFGGMAPTTVLATKTMGSMIGRSWNDTMVAEVTTSLATELSLPPGVPGGMEAYRQSLVLGFFFKFYCQVVIQRQREIRDQGSHDNGLHSDLASPCAIGRPERDLCQGIQVVEQQHHTHGHHDIVGRPAEHRSAQQQASGEAIYADDVPSHHGQLYLALVTSTKAHAQILSVDASVALRMRGVVDFVSHTDVPGANAMGLIVKDELVFAQHEVGYYGQVIGAILADTQAHAQRAAKCVTVEYEEKTPIVTIEDAIANNSFIETDCSLKLQQGDVTTAFDTCDHVIEGEAHIGGQEHFYLETQAAFVVPRDQGELEILCSTQSPSEAQNFVSTATGIPQHKIQVRAKRLGGAFGGKQTDYRVLLVPCAVAAVKHRRPVRCALDRDEDMVVTGTRHGFLGKYKVGFMHDGRIIAVKADFYSNCGDTLDLSSAVMEKAVMGAANAYKLPHLCFQGHLCKTNLPPNTAFRAFGAPQAIFICETWMNHVATTLQRPPEEIQRLNLLQDGDVTAFGNVAQDCNILRCWQECHKGANFDQRKKKVEEYNVKTQWKKRGIAVTPIKFGVAFLETFLNQGGALVHIYTDGSVIVSHSGVEMGQGLHTKIIQIAGRVLGIPVTRVHIAETSTQTVPNMSPSAASASSDIIGMATIEACTTLKERLQPYADAKPDGSWEELVTAAYQDRVSLSSTGFYKTPGLNWDWKTCSGVPYAYDSVGAACSVVEIDCLTGDHALIRTDIVMDVGRSLNPAIDMGQIEGGFVQGYGLLTLEELKVSPDGVLLSRGPGMYKIPAFGDIPSKLNVTLLKDAPNEKAVYSSKAVGEPPLLLAISVFFALKDAVASARRQVAHGSSDPSSSEDYFRLDSPATAERIRMGCPDQFKVSPPEPGSYRPWTVPV